MAQPERIGSQVLRDAFARIEEVARENEILKAELAELRERHQVLALGLGQSALLIRLAALVREFRDRATVETRAGMFAELAYYDAQRFGPDGPSARVHEQMLKVSFRPDAGAERKH